jgi:hypothetical protein
LPKILQRNIFKALGVVGGGGRGVVVVAVGVVVVVMVVVVVIYELDIINMCNKLDIYN